ncbi:PREDICTED: general odorant-binding protein 84a [Bactrocera latifrons]|uniref:general odorant-binding protein 84a n=1 Tax=Bactrocera latifrons TaxID=174628 RepID=UPI0008DE61F4|nr:PREDICTED: general odorant-binding protein 84a [Bactrocera latifrons]
MSNRNVFVMIPFTIILLYCDIMVSVEDRAKDNGDIFVQHREQRECVAPIMVHANGSNSSEDMDVAHICNNSFSIPSDYIVQFNRNGDLPETVDKTGMCFIRCYFEKAGLIKNWQLNKDLIMQTMWPIKADSIAFCEPEEKQEMNACVRSYAIAKCLMKRGFQDTCNDTVA